MEDISTSERTLVNLRGFCLYCLGRIDRSYGVITNAPTSPSPGARIQTSVTPGASSSPYTPLKNRFVHSLPLEERIAPFADLCRYLGIDVPDNYAFGDGIESESLTPPLCLKCHELTARLCMLQEELQYIQTRISNTVKRIYKRVQATCGDQRKGAMKRKAFQKEFWSKSRGLSRRRRENLTSRDSKKTVEMLKFFQMKVLEKECMEEHNETQQRGIISFFTEWQSPVASSTASPAPLIPKCNNDKDDVGIKTKSENEEENDDEVLFATDDEETDKKEETEVAALNCTECEHEDRKRVSIVEDDFLPSQTVLWDACTMENSIIQGIKANRNEIETYKSKLQALNETEEKNSCPSSKEKSSIKPSIHNFRTPQEYYAQNHKDSKTPKSDGTGSGTRKLLNHILHSPNVTSRNHRLKVRRRLLLPKHFTKDNDDDKDEVVLPF